VISCDDRGPTASGRKTGDPPHLLACVDAIRGGDDVAQIDAARNPSHRSLIAFAIWSSVVHGGIMAAGRL